MRSPSVKALRSKLGMTQQAFASLLGFSFVSVNKWENDGSTPTGLSAVLLSLLESALHAHPPVHVVQALRGAGGVPLAVVRTLTELERTDGRPQT
ncbi:helix-turn-helix domain-containing protein [Sorangium sp. So ce145]|uniref:helix-turn-helix domain-containing protein n=1 Tax=Sorangium sp. So ce145 TaxID=3133285 RepID=UPI003F6263C6